MRIARQASALALLGLLAVGGCAHRVYDQTTTANAALGPRAGRDPSEVELLATPPQRRYQSLGQIRTQARPFGMFSPRPSREDAESALRREAARLGADAVINVAIGDRGYDALGILAGGVRGEQVSGTGEAVMWLP